jgi:Crinkler effector protein N-terminal domain
MHHRVTCRRDHCSPPQFLQSALPETEIFMAGIILLNCSILEPDVDNAFPVKISHDETVGALKDAIKEKKSTKLAHIDADELDVWKVGHSAQRGLP